MQQPRIPRSVLAATAGAILLAGLFGLSGCRQDGEAASRPSVADFDVADALAHADPARYSAAVTLKSTGNGLPSVVSRGRLNLNGPVTGHLTVRNARYGESEALYTGEHAYVRLQGSDGRPGRWKALPGAVNGRLPLGNLSGYAELLAARPGADKGLERTAGVAVHRLAGTILADQLATMDPDFHHELVASHTRSFDCEIWVTAQGRVVRFERSVVVAGRTPLNNVVTLSRFGEPEPVAAPASA